MQDTTGSVPDGASRRSDCAAPSNSIGESRGRECAAPIDLPQIDKAWRGCLRALAELNARLTPDGMCPLCLICGLGDRGVQHLPSCAFGQMLTAIAMLGNALTQTPLPPLKASQERDAEPLCADGGFVETYEVELDPIERPTETELR